VYRSIGTQLSGEIAYRYGDAGLPEDTIELQLNGSAGQALGVFLVNGIKIVLRGEANDYVGEGMNGGKIVLLPSPEATFNPTLNVICGNTCLYGATGGKLFIYGQAGERYGVRNSGATAVVEGVGDHACEYMTGGVCVVLGRTGRNFAAGMSGGVAYVYDEDGTFPLRCNSEGVAVEPTTVEDGDNLQHILRRHAALTDSDVAARLLDNWTESLNHFVTVVPEEYRRLLERGEGVNADGCLSAAKE
jgi:glutamate synthase domain-containing protein 3